MTNSLTLVLSGQAGQGLKTIEELLGKAIKQSYNVFTITEVMSRVRGGNNTVEIRLSNTPVYAYKENIDLLFLLNSNAFYRLDYRLTNTTEIFGEEGFMTSEQLEAANCSYNPLPLSALAKEAGSALYSNTLLYGFIAGLLGLDETISGQLLTEKFHAKSDKIIQGNLKAFTLGYNNGGQFQHLNPIQKTTQVAKHKIINGSEAISIGAIAGGINYIASYPMSPATAVLEYLASKGQQFGIAVEQAEDEIAALNMVIGGWYAGARSMATTSGGGFALMEEAVSLSGITETPAVIHIAQRPGPGTGLPTRTEQADLNLAVYSGHGEFPRIVLAPGTLEDGILLTQRAFYLADKYQVPTFVLSDQFYLDGRSTVAPVPLEEASLTSFVVESKSDYKRYALTDNGISPRAIPGYGQGLVKCDSDEHDEGGSITEDFNVRVLMNDKRLGKDAYILEDYIEPLLIGNPEFTSLIIGWGSTYGVIKEAVESASSDKVAFLHIRQLFPLSPSLLTYINQADRVVVMENNATGQLASLLKQYLDVHVHQQVLKYNGVPFTIEEVDHTIKEVF